VRGASGTRRVSAGPAVVLAVVTAIDLVGGPDLVVLTLVVIAPLIAATVLSPRATAAYAAAAVVLAALLGVYDRQYVGVELTAQLVRLLGVALGGAAAVAASRVRVRREVQLAHTELVAAATQQALLTQVPPRVGELEVATSYTSADVDAAVGGDLYEVMATPWGVRVLVGDVRGKGLEAVAIAARVLGTFRALAASRKHGEDVLADLDRVVELAAGTEDFVTAVLLEITGDQVTAWNAGHPAPLLLSRGTPTRLEPAIPQPPLGLSPRPQPQSYRLRADDLLLVYTDGLVEARHPKTREFFPLDDAAVRTLRPGDLPAALRDLGREVAQWAGGLSDDVAMVLLRPSPPGEDRWLRRPPR
jgi:sigma-B regulation protein RsbU (phosphoserine phosphatase)